MSNHINRLINALQPDREGFSLVNVKFFLGDDRNITQDMLGKEAGNAFSQVSLGFARQKDSIDKDITTRNINQFLKSV